MANETLDTIRKIVKNITPFEVVTLVTEIELNKHHQPDGSGRTTFAPQDQAGDTVTPLTSPSTRCTTN